MKKLMLRAACGFLSAALSVLIFHQATVFLLTHFGLLQAEAWSLNPVEPWGVPRILNQMFWGGLWGVLYALAGIAVFRGPRWLIGALFGLAVVTLGNFTLVPLLRDLPLFAAYRPDVILKMILIHAMFGIGLALIYQKLEPYHSPPFKIIPIS